MSMELFARQAGYTGPMQTAAQVQAFVAWRKDMEKLKEYNANLDAMSSPAAPKITSPLDSRVQGGFAVKNPNPVSAPGTAAAQAPFIPNPAGPPPPPEPTTFVPLGGSTGAVDNSKAPAAKAPSSPAAKAPSSPAPPGVGGATTLDGGSGVSAEELSAILAGMTAMTQSQNQATNSSLQALFSGMAALSKKPGQVGAQGAQGTQGTQGVQGVPGKDLSIATKRKKNVGALGLLGG